MYAAGQSGHARVCSVRSKGGWATLVLHRSPSLHGDLGDIWEHDGVESSVGSARAATWRVLSPLCRTRCCVVQLGLHHHPQHPMPHSRPSLGAAPLSEQGRQLGMSSSSAPQELCEFLLAESARSVQALAFLGQVPLTSPQIRSTSAQTGLTSPQMKPNLRQLGPKLA